MHYLRGLRKVNKTIKQIPTVNKNTQSLLDAKFSQLEKLNQVKSDYANEQYRIKNQSSIKHVEHHTEASILIHRNGQQINNTEY